MASATTFNRSQQAPVARVEIAPNPRGDQAPTARSIPAWGDAPCVDARNIRGLKARPITPSIPHISFVAFHAIFLHERPHLPLEITPPVMRLLGIDVTDQRIHIRWPNGKRRIPFLPCEFRQTGRLGLEPFGGRGLQLSHQLRDRRRPRQANGEMNVVCDTAHAIAFASGIPRHRREVGMKIGAGSIVQRGRAALRAEDHMNQNKRERLRHGGNYRSGLQPSHRGGYDPWGVAPCWYSKAPSAL